MKFTIILNLFIFLMINNAYAYLDPGTGGFIIQMIIAFFAAAFVFINNFWQKLKSVFVKLLTILSCRKNKEK